MYLYFLRIENTPTAQNAQQIFALKAAVDTELCKDESFGI